MKYYNYNRETLEFISEGIADLDPLENKPLIPGNATTIDPKTPKAGFVKIFKNDQWEEIEDFRGDVWDTTNKNKITYNKIGPLPENLTNQAPKEFDKWSDKNKKWEGHIKNKKEFDSKKWFRDRAENYPSLPDQLDMIYWDKINGTNLWGESIKKIKDKYPKV